ncbi:MAG TPA: PAS domain S-box protein, partial [Victivallales bacterium]|nr:PAS domain S-box protein [Victivallales bacterium]
VAIENSSEAIVITDPSGIIKYVNKAFERVTGFSGYEAIGRTPSILKSGEHDENFYKNLWNHLINKKTWEGHFINKRKDGTKYHEEALISPVLDEKGEIINYVAIKRDITERLNLEKQLQSAQKLEAIGRIAGGVAHDFNNMLSVIIGFAELAREKVAEHPVAKDIDEIIKAGKKSSQLTRQLLIFSRRDISKPEFIKLNKFIDENLNMLRKTLSKNISFLFTASERELTVKIDPSQLTQVLMNICINAKDAIGEEKDGKVEIAVRPFDVSKDSDKNIHTFNERFYARISISDNGCGMEPEILANIFEPFFTTKPKEYGTGLGLSTVYGIVKQNNGFITVDTSSGKGSTFNIYLPLVQENGASSHISTPISMKEEEERKRILVVEDDPSILAICTSILKKENYEVLSFSNTREALRTIKGEKKIDLLLTDVVMPDMNGKELAEEVLKTFPTCKVLYMSGYTSDIILTKGIIEEETNFIRKPFTRNELIEQILKILR